MRITNNGPRVSVFATTTPVHGVVMLILLEAGWPSV
jgi:hypothetical protein